MKSGVRCFKHPRDEGRCGVWIMTRPLVESSKRGIFFHGDREEIQAPAWSIATLVACGKVVEITPDEALNELASWPEGQQEARKVLERHR